MYLLGRHPETHFFTFANYLTLWHSVQRVWYFCYKTKKCFYLCDFCYCMLALTFYFINFDPKNKTLFRIVFVLESGPVLFMVWMLKNKLALHNFQNMTGLVLHLLPAIMMYHVRYYMMPAEAHLPEEQRRFCSIGDDSDMTWDQWRWEMWFNQARFYCCWLAGYSVFNKVFENFIEKYDYDCFVKDCKKMGLVKKINKMTGNNIFVT